MHIYIYGRCTIYIYMYVYTGDARTYESIRRCIIYIYTHTLCAARAGDAPGAALRGAGPRGVGAGGDQ